MKSRISALAIAALLASFGVFSTIAAQDDAHDLQIAGVEVSEVGETSSVVRYEALVEVVNASEDDFDGVARIDYQIDGGEESIAYIVTELAAGQTARFTFRFDLAPGNRTLGVLIGETAYEKEIHVTAADLNVSISNERLMRGGIVELDFSVANSGGRTAASVALSGRWEEIGEGGATEEFGFDVGTLEAGGSVEVSTTVSIAPGSYRFFVEVSTSTVETVLDDNEAEAEYDIEFVDLSLELVSAEPIRWHTDGRGLVAISVDIANVGIDDSGSLLLGVECEDGMCSEMRRARSTAAGETWTAVLEAWLPVGDKMVTLYVGGNEDGFRWGEGNVITALIDVPKVPPLEWALTSVSEMQDIQYWSDGSANVVFQTMMENVGSDLVSGELSINVKCERAGEALEGCGGDFKIEVDPTNHPDVTHHTVRVPRGETNLYFSYGDAPPLTSSVEVPGRILGVDRDVWDCFRDTSHIGSDVPDDAGVGCGGWRNEYVVKWPIGEPVRVWTTGDDDYEAVFNQVLDDVGPLLNIEFKPVRTKSMAQLSVYLGLPREDTRLENLNCNRAAGCAWFEIASDRSINEAEMVVWPPVANNDRIGRDHMIYSVALHELIHVLTGMLHRHDDRSSVMSYDSLDYKTLSETDAELLRIASHPLVEPGTRLRDVGRLIVFDDELVDPRVMEAPTVEEVLRQVHAKLMDDGTARFEITGGWPECNFMFGPSAYSIGGIRPRAPRWVHISNEDVNAYIIRSAVPVQAIEFWIEVNGTWRRVPSLASQRLLSFRDSFTNPLGLLSSINVYAEASEMKVVSRDENILSLEYSLNGADVRVGWSRSTKLDVNIEIDTDDYTISSYEMDWTFEPEETGVCGTYRVDATKVDYGFKFDFPEAIRDGSPLID